jgi:hypothetical protein
MNNKQLAEMIKNLREKKLEDIIGKPPPFNPVHPEGKEDSSSPNQYAHRKQVAEGLGSTYHLRKRDEFKGTLGNGKKRNEWQRDGQQSMRGGLRYTYSEDNKKEVEVGKTDTGQSGEEIDTNPPDNTFSAKGSTNQNTNTKEIKEKKNATMG